MYNSVGDSFIFTKSFNRMAHNFMFRAFLDTIIREAMFQGVPIQTTEPAFTSIIGELKYAHRYPLSRHQAAAFVIGRRGMGIHKENILRSFQIVLGQYQTNGRKRYWSAKNYSNWGLWKLLTVLVTTKRFQSLLRRSHRATPLRPGSEADLISISVKKKLVRGNNDLDSQTFDPG